MAFTVGQRSLGKIDMKSPTTQIAAAAFSPDNRYLLIGSDELDNPLLGRAMLFDFGNGKEIGNITKLAGVPDRIDLAANGIGLLQGQNLRPRLYRFPTGDAFAKIPGPPPPATAGFVQLFNGKDLTGWKKPKISPGNWRVENGILVGSTVGKVGGRLYTDRPQPQDFHLRVEARISDQGSGAVFFRCTDGTLIGYEAQLNSTVAPVAKTGSLYAQIPGRRIDLALVDMVLAPPDQWFTLEIIAEGNRLIVKVDGKTTADVVDRNHPPAPEHIALMQNAFSKVEFRRIEIKELRPTAPRCCWSSPRISCRSSMARI